MRLQRFAKRPDGTFGWLTVGPFACFTVEPPWHENRVGKSCVPAGLYRLVLEFSPRFNRKLWELKDVPGRSEAKIHPANRAAELEGCIAPGETIGHDAQGWFISNSRATVEAFHKTLGDATEAELLILDVPGPHTRLAQPETPGPM